MCQISHTIVFVFLSLKKPEKIPHFAWCILWAGSGWEGLDASGGPEKELVESEVAEGAWGGEWGSPSPLTTPLSLPSPLPFPLPSHPLIAPCLTRESVHRLDVIGHHTFASTEGGCG